MARKAGAGAAGLILMTLCAGQFLMMLDSSVMNVSIATVAKDVGTTVTGIQTAITLYTLVMASFMITGGKIGQIIGRKRAFAIGCVIYGCGSLTTALAPNLTVLLIGWSCLEGLGRGADPARDRRPRRRQLRPRRTAPRLRPGHRRRGDRGRGRPDRRRLLHHLPLLALRLRRRGPARGRDPRPRPSHRGRRGGAEGAAGPGRHRALGPRPRADRARRPALGDLGLRQGQARGARMDRALAGDLADPRRRRRAGALPRLGEPPGRARGRAAGRPGDPAGPGPARRPHLVLLPVLPPGRHVLRDAALPLDRPRALGDRNGRAPAAALLHPDPRRGRDPEALPATSRRAGSSASASSAMFAGLVVMVAALEAGAGAGDRHLAAAPGRPRDGRARLAARQRHRLLGPRRAERRGRRPAEHRHQPRHLGRHGADRRDRHRRPQLLLPHRRRGKPAPCRRRSRRRASTELSGGIPFLSDDELETALDEAPGSRPAPPTRSSKRTKKRAWSACAPPSRSSPCSPWSGSASPAGSRPGSRPRQRSRPRRPSSGERGSPLWPYASQRTAAPLSYSRTAWCSSGERCAAGLHCRAPSPAPG